MKLYSAYKNGILTDQWNSNFAGPDYKSSENGYTVIENDITSKIALDNEIKKRQIKRNFGLLLIDKIAVLNESKGLNFEQVESFMLNFEIKILKAHLESGNIDSFIEKLNNSDVSMFFSSQEKQNVISECNNFLDDLG